MTSFYNGSLLARLDGKRPAAKVVWQKRTWDVVLAPVARMEARGLTPEMLGPGKPVTLVGYPRKDGTPEMRIERVIASGKTVELR